LKQALAGWVFALWLILTSVFLYIWALADYGYFDESSLWLGEVHFPLSASDFPDLKAQGEEAQWLFVHVSEAGCRCNKRTERHIEDLNLPAQSYTEISLTRVEAERLGWTIPATPLLIVASGNRHNLSARYVGPYASGPLCSSENSFIPSVMQNSMAESLWLNGNVKACRCL